MQLTNHNFDPDTATATATATATDTNHEDLYEPVITSHVVQHCT